MSKWESRIYEANVGLDQGSRTESRPEDASNVKLFLSLLEVLVLVVVVFRFLGLCCVRKKIYDKAEHNIYSDDTSYYCKVNYTILYYIILYLYLLLCHSLLYYLQLISYNIQRCYSSVP